MMGTKVNVDHEIEVELESHELAAVRRLRYLDDIMTDVLDSARAAGHRLASETVAGSGRLRAPRGTPLIEKRGLRCCRAGASPAYDIRCDPRCSRTRAEGTRSNAPLAMVLHGGTRWLPCAVREDWLRARGLRVRSRSSGAAIRSSGAMATGANTTDPNTD